MHKLKKLLLASCILTLMIVPGCSRDNSQINLEERYNQMAQKSVDLEDTVLNLEQALKHVQKEKENLNLEIKSLIVEKNDLASEVSELNEIVETLSIDNEVFKAEGVKSQLKERLGQVSLAFDSGNHSLVIELANSLHSDFEGSPEDIEAQALKIQSEKIIAIAIKSKNESDKRAAESEARAVKEKEEREKEKAAKEKAKNIISITNLSQSDPDDEGFVDLFINYENMSDNVIELVDFFITPYDSSGNVVHSLSDNKSTMRAQDSGPRSKGEGLKGGSGSFWDSAWQSFGISSLKLDKVVIEYNDGSSIALEGKDLSYIMD